MFPDGDAAAVMELTESQLHVEERHASKHCHQQVRQQKGTWAQQRTEQITVSEEKRNTQWGSERGDNGKKVKVMVQK